jgi:hypothetical protein
VSISSPWGTTIVLANMMLPQPLPGSSVLRSDVEPVGSASMGYKGISLSWATSGGTHPPLLPPDPETCYKSFSSSHPLWMRMHLSNVSSLLLDYLEKFMGEIPLIRRRKSGVTVCPRPYFLLLVCVQSEW